MKPAVTDADAQAERDTGADLLRAIKAQQAPTSTHALLVRALEAKYGTPPAGDGEGS